MESPKRRDFRRRLYDQKRGSKASPAWQSLILLFVAMGIVLWIWQPWLTPEERILATAERFKKEVSQGVAEETQKVAEAKRRAMERFEGATQDIEDIWVAGSNVRFVVNGPDKDTTAKQISGLKYRVMETGKLFDPEDKLSAFARLHAAEPGTWVNMPPLFVSTLNTYLGFARATDGRCDPTIGVMVKAYHYGDREPDDKYPPEEERSKLLKLVDSSLVQVNTAKNQVRLTKKDVLLDWVTLGRAAMLDTARRYAEENNIANYIVFAGYDSISSGVANAGDPWSRDLPDPDAPTFRRLGRMKMPDNQAVGVAFVNETGRKVKKHWIHPFIKPSTGIPGRDALQVMAVDKNPARAVIGARCAFVLGAADGTAFLKKQRMSGLFTDMEGTRHLTGDFSQYYFPDEKPVMYQ